jgi:hypothetical protein
LVGLDGDNYVYFMTSMRYIVYSCTKFH